ncbi:MAG: phosphoribosylamine--glycine ligase [Cellulosilyticaceae bacterium]
MKVLVVGNGGRESAIAQTIKRFHPDATLYMAPGNGGTYGDLIQVPINVDKLEALADFAVLQQVDLTIVGPEVPLVQGIVDVFMERGLRIFGPNQEAAQFEGSKDFTKAFLMRHHIPTARYQSFKKEQIEEAKEALYQFTLPVVVKADGLAAGKGVLICASYEEAREGIECIFADKFEGAGDCVVIEEFLTGTEASLLCFVDGKTIVPMETARDYKRIFDEDQGLNTGGMGGFSPNPIISENVANVVEETVLRPIIKGFQEENLDFRGILFIGLMIEEGLPKVLEFNVRFGDPETQSVLPRLETDLVAIMNACIDGTLGDIDIQWSTQKSVTVVLASKGYPETSHKGDIIKGLDALDVNTALFHGGTARKGEDFITDGGRVLALTRLAPTLEEAREAVYSEVQKIQFEGMQYRTDIAKTL